MDSQYNKYKTYINKVIEDKRNKNKEFIIVF